MSMEKTKVLLRPSLRFIATLPTLKLKEEIRGNIIVWKVELDEPVGIITGYQTLMNLNTFYIGAMTLERFSQEKGWQYDLKIGIYKYRPLNFSGLLIEPVDEDFYLHRKWWDRVVTVGQGDGK